MSIDLTQFESPQSRVEEILQNILGASYDVDPESRVEKLLQNLIEVAYIVDPMSRVELLLENLQGGSNEVVPMSRVEMLIANALGASYEVVPQSRVEELLVLLAEEYATVYKTVTGAIVTFDDAVPNEPFKQLVVDINPVQDLHGYDSPWVAGGGKNLLAPKFYDGVGYNVAVGTTLTLTEAVDVTASGDAYTRTVGNWGGFGMRSPQLATGTYYLMAELASPNMRSSIYVLNSDMSVSRNLGNQGSGTARSIGMVITLSGDEAYIAFNCLTSSAGNVSISTPMVALSSTATSFAPYENLCPISGWTEVDVEQSGVNVWNEEVESGYFYTSNGAPASSNAAYRSKNYIPVKPNTTYFFKNDNHATNSKVARFFFYDKNKTFIISPSGDPASRVFTVPDNAYFMRFYVNEGIENYTNTLSINYPSTATPYEPYTGRSIPISWQTEAGTVYGGKLDVLRGVPVITHKGVDMGSLSWSMQAGTGTQLTRFNTAGIANDVSREQTQVTYPVMLDLKAPFLVPNSNPVYSRSVDNAMCVLCSNGTFYATCSLYTSAADFKTAVSGMMLVYRLAEPIEIQLTPTEVRSLLGKNNIWADCGDVTVEYKAYAE